MVPARHAREVVVEIKGGTPPPPPQPPAEIVAKVNAALGSSDALAIRRLQSGDIVVSFRGNAEDHARDKSWVKTAFGDRAILARHMYAVLAKGIPSDREKGRGRDTKGYREGKRGKGSQMQKEDTKE